jgi:DNA-binding MarR family transcriptional regulator
MTVAEPVRTASATVLLTRLVRQVYRRSDVDQLGMSLKAFATLTHLREQDVTGQQALAGFLCIDANALVLVLNELEDAGYARRRRDPADRRRHIVESTPAGLAALARAEAWMSSIEDDVLGTLEPQERTQLQALLARALEGLAPLDLAATSTVDPVDSVASR